MPYYIFYVAIESTGFNLPKFPLETNGSTGIVWCKISRTSLHNVIQKKTNIIWKYADWNLVVVDKMKMKYSYSETCRTWYVVCSLPRCVLYRIPLDQTVQITPIRRHRHAHMHTRRWFWRLLEGINSGCGSSWSSFVELTPTARGLKRRWVSQAFLK